MHSFSRFDSRFPIWMILLSGSLTAQVVKYLLHGAVLEWYGFPGRVIDGTILQRGSQSIGNIFFLKVVLLSILSFVFFAVALAFLARILSRRSPFVHNRVETEVISTLAAFILVLTCLSAIVGARPDLDDFCAVLFVAIGLILVFMGLKEGLSRGDSKLRKLGYRFPGYSVTMVITLLAAVMAIVYQALFSQLVSADWELLLVVPLLVIWFIGMHVAMAPRLSRLPGMSKAKLGNWFCVSLSPMMMIPISLPLSNELQFAVSHLYAASPDLIWAILAMSLTAASLVLGIVLLRRDVPWRATKVVNNYYLPVAIATLATFLNYRHFLEVGHVIDLFHWGEMVVPVQQLFQFGKIPFVDLLPTHGFRDILFQFFYSLLNGYRGLESLIWTYWLNVAMAVLLYFLLARVVSPLFSFLFVLSVPWVTIFTFHGVDYSLVVLPALALCRAIERPNFRRMIVLWLAMAITFWWRYDAGLFAIASCLLILPAALMRRDRRIWRTALISFCIVWSACLVCWLALVAARGYSPIELARQFRLQLTVLGSGQGYLFMWPEWNAVTFLMYFLLPAVYIGYIVYLVIEVGVRKRELSGSVYLLGFLALMSLLLSVRHLGRHGMMEGYKALFGVFLLASVPVLAGMSRRITEATFLAVILVHTMVLGHYAWTDTNTARKQQNRHRTMLALQNWSDTNFRTGEWFRFHVWKNKESRLRNASDWQYRGLKPFLDKNLKPHSTFYDFSNSTIIYDVTDREVVSYLLQGQIHTGEPIQRYQLKRMSAKFQKGELPYVVFKARNDFDFVDGVPNELRSYRIAEFIYKHYRPLGYVGRYEIWRARDLNPQDEPAQIVRKIPLVLRTDDETSDGLRQGSAGGLAFKSGGPESRLSNFLDLLSLGPLDPKYYWFLKLSCRTSRDGPLHAYFRKLRLPLVHGFSCRQQVFAADPGEWEDVIVPIEIASGDQPEQLTDVILIPPSESVFEIRAAEVIAATAPLFPMITSIGQRLNFGMVPYVWAKYDDGRAWSKAPIVRSISPKQVCGPGKDLSLDFGENIDKSDGSYLQLKMHSEQPCRATVSVPGKPESSIEFKVLDESEASDYVIRLSCLWAWMKDGTGKIILRSEEPIWVQEAILRRGD